MHERAKVKCKRMVGGSRSTEGAQCQIFEACVSQCKRLFILTEEGAVDAREVAREGKGKGTCQPPEEPAANARAHNAKSFAFQHRRSKYFALDCVAFERHTIQIFCISAVDLTRVTRSLFDF